MERETVGGEDAAEEKVCLTPTDVSCSWQIQGQIPGQSWKSQLPLDARGPQNYGFKSYLAEARILPASSYTSRKEIRPSSPTYHPEEQLQEALGLFAADVGEGF